jgi:hypothetical protein
MPTMIRFFKDMRGRAGIDPQAVEKTPIYRFAGWY